MVRRLCASEHKAAAFRLRGLRVRTESVRLMVQGVGLRQDGVAVVKAAGFRRAPHPYINMYVYEDRVSDFSFRVSGLGFR